jgi:AraC-like DNA-binding protein
MPESSSYGEAFGERLHAKAASFVSRSVHGGLVAVTEVKCDVSLTGLSSSLVREDAFLVALQLRDYPVHEYWEDERASPRNALRAGDTTIYDLKRDPVFLINNPFHSIHFYLPRAALDALADSAHALRIDELHYEPGVGRDDRVVRALAESLLPAFEYPEQANRLFVDQVILAAGIHVASAYGGMKSERVTARGGLAPWQKKRAIEIIEANLDGDISSSELARECGLSASHFARAFRESTGLAPHQWLLQRRVEKAKQAMRETNSSLVNIALACGFANQSHFTRVFSKFTGISPGSWRRQLSSGKRGSREEMYSLA